MLTLPQLERILEAMPPLEAPRATRLPLLLWPLTDLEADEPGAASRCLRDLELRGAALISSWDHEKPDSLERALLVGRIARDLGLPVVVNANRLLHRFCNGDERTAHVDDGGRPFFDFSFDPRVPIGCPFALDFRLSEIRGRVERFADAYCRERVTPLLVFADWEIDGPLDGNGAWEAARRCRRCRGRVGRVEDHAAFQAAVRARRAALQRAAFADPLRQRFAGVLVGNYAVHPHDGWRYWYDWFERLADGAPFRADQRARYRPWADEFTGTGYTLAMPVLYNWYPVFSWYDYAEPDYRWLRPLLLEASSVGRSAPAGLPIAPFVHWHTTSLPPEPDPAVRQLSAAAYREMLWHGLLRGAATLFLWCRADETQEEVRLVHEVFAEAQRYARFIDEGVPELFDVPAEPGPVVSARGLGDQALVRRSDFGPADVRGEARGGVRAGECRVVPRSALATG